MSESIVTVEFLDHCEDAHAPLRCTVWGRLMADEKDWIVVRCWDGGEGNSKDFCIVRGAITRMTDATGDAR